MSLDWYVLRSKPNKEMILARELSARGFECFYPQLQVQPINPRSHKIRPYFPGYLFLHIDIKEVSVSTFEWMPYSNGFVSFGGTLATVPESLIRAIRQQVYKINRSNNKEITDLNLGEIVVIEGGPFDGYKAIFDAHLPGSARVRVLLQLLQARQISLELPATQIQRKKRRE